MKRDIKKETTEEERNLLQISIQTTSLEIRTGEEEVKRAIQSIKTKRSALKKAKETVAIMRKNRGWPVDSITTMIEHTLKEYKIHPEAYHAGHYVTQCLLV